MEIFSHAVWFERGASYLLQDELGSEVVVPLQLVLYFSDTFENHLINLLQLFDTLYDIDFGYMHPKKCQFAMSEVGFVATMLALKVSVQIS